MAFDAFVAFRPGSSSGSAKPPIGESQDSTYKGCFEIKSFEFGAETELSITSATGGAGAGKAKFKEFSIKKLVDTASPNLLVNLGLGGHFNIVNLYIRKAGADTSDGKAGLAFLVFAFGMVAVKSIDWSGEEGEEYVTESVVFEYGELAIGYYPQLPTGLFGPVKAGQWSKLNNGTTMLILTGTTATSNDPTQAPVTSGS